MGASLSKMLIVAAALTLTACATTQSVRMHSEDELNTVALRCGLALGELFQDEIEKRLLFLMRPGATAGERGCVTRWARANGLNAVFIGSIQFPEP